MYTTTDTFVLVHANVISDGRMIEDATISVRNGIIQSITTESSRTKDPLIDCAGLTVGPGLIDMHIHGCGGFDTTQQNLAENIQGMAAFLQEHGITSFQLAIAMNFELLTEIGKVVDAHPELMNNLISVYTEGPFIALEKKGGIPNESIKAPDEGYLNRILSIEHEQKPIVTTMTTAPELDGIDTIHTRLQEAGVVVASGHSQVYFDQLTQMKDAHITHLYNAMVGLAHRRPGLALLPFMNKDATYELICDYVHVDKEMIHFTLERLGTSRMCLISDGMSFCGRGKGTGRYLGKDIHSDGKACYYSDSNILIGSGMLICDTARQLYADGFIDKVQFFEIAATNPSRVLKLTDRGTIEPGKTADLVLMDDDMHVVRTIKRSIPNIPQES